MISYRKFNNEMTCCESKFVEKSKIKEIYKKIYEIYRGLYNK